MANQPIRWLHLSDLHLGCRGEALWWQVQDEFERSVREHAAKLGMPDLILFTGDLTFQGSEQEFRQVDGFLESLQGWLSEAAGLEQRPLVFPVPGNHDLERPSGKELRNLRFLENYPRGRDDPDIAQFQDDLWTRRDASDIAPLFANYEAWFERSVRAQFKDPRCELHRSHFPGDLSLQFKQDGKPALRLVGLNSAWMQYRGGDLKGQLELPREQFHAALGKSGLQGFKDADQALLLMHHPLDWLSSRAQAVLRDEIYTPDRFTLCLHGHMHEGRSRSVAESGGDPRHWLQSPSLFGLERYGSADEERAIGYSWGELSDDGRVRVWPLLQTRSGGRMVFVPDSGFLDFPAVIRKPSSADEESPRPPSISSVDVAPWLEQTLADTQTIELRGIGSGEGSVQTASCYDIERLYTQLRCREQGIAGVDGQGLEALLPRHRLLLLEGQPGAGKTTFLRFTAAQLARDRLGRPPPPDGASWRQRYLGMDADSPRRIPVFLRLSLVDDLMSRADADPRRPDNRQRVLDWMLPDEASGQRQGWQRLFESGEVLLLLDGMDEISDEVRRGRVLAVLRDLVAHWPRVPVVVTSRPIDLRPLVEMGFTHSVIEPFGRQQVEDFISHWIGALYQTDEAAGQGPAVSDAERARADGYHQKLQTAITARPELRRLAANPVMLTCLCVVHWNEGGLPDARARLYRAVLRWLRAARGEQRQALDISDRFAELAFAVLALEMMEGGGSATGGKPGGKKALFDLDDAVDALLPMAERSFPGRDKADYRKLLSDWLRFECSASGIVEQLGRNRLRFWHLTFQEYLAAQQLAWLGGGSDDEDWWSRVRARLDDPQWRECIDLLPGCLLDTGESRMDRLLERVLGLLSEDAGLPEQARVAGVMGRLLESVEVYQYAAPIEVNNAYRRLLDDAMAIFTVKGAAQVPVADRIAAAEALGRGGDPRLARGRDPLIEVPGLDGWSLGKYPVTVEDYLAFIDSGGYHEPRWWDSDGWTLREKEDWQSPDNWDEQLRTPNRPVVRISWFEAAAYCAWLSAQSGREVRLPTEVQWQRAADGGDGRKYPWGGEEPDAERANFNQDVGSPTPVGVYPAGDGPFGHCDLGGNVWEWCSDDFPEDELPDLWRGKPGGARVLRGGGWGDPAVGLQAARRGWGPAPGRGDVFGFRVAVAPASLGP